MTNTELLRIRIEESGYKFRFLARKIGITYQCFIQKVNNKSEFKASEIKALCAVLDLDAADREDIFFADDVGKMSTNIAQEARKTND